MKILEFEELGSTQLEAKKYAKNNGIPDEGAVIIAKNQTNGIGTHGRRWLSKNGENITFTMVLKPNCKIEKLDNITLQIANCIIQVIKELYNVNLDIKKPNDIVFNGKKLGGILTQVQSRESQISFLFIGIGLNTNQTVFPAEIKAVASSIKSEFGIDINNKSLTNYLIEQIYDVVSKLIIS